MRLTDTTVVTDPGTGVPVVLLAGGELPEWAAPLVGDHLLTDSEPIEDQDDDEDADEQEAGADEQEAAKPARRRAPRGKSD